MKQDLPEALRIETRGLHVQAERSTFMGLLLRGQMQRTAYCALLRNLHAIYAALEPALQRHAADPLIAPLVLPGLWREPGLHLDLDLLHGNGRRGGSDWRIALPLQPATLRYVARLDVLDRTQPALLAAHSYVRYLGDLSGGQMLSRIVRESLQLGTAGGTSFYEFGDAAATADLKRAYRAGLAALPVDDATQSALVAEARFAFELHGQLFDQLAGAVA
ncbi:MAG: biliverdin-producing heme oxygenase [Comamonadaceae bacterium]|nr:MAG: biliverdin-producing heme oxygenase [Comamonadaceae bacterium]